MKKIRVRKEKIQWDKLTWKNWIKWIYTHMNKKIEWKMQIYLEKWFQGDKLTWKMEKMDHTLNWKKWKKMSWKNDWMKNLS